MNFMLERQEQHVSNDLFVFFCFFFCFFFLIKPQIDSTELYLYLTRLPES